MGTETLSIIVTGAAGFIGSHLCDRLRSRGHVVHQLDKLQGTSTSEFSTLKRFLGYEIDFIVHLGANCSSQKNLTRAVGYRSGTKTRNPSNGRRALRRSLLQWRNT